MAGVRKDTAVQETTKGADEGSEQTIKKLNDEIARLKARKLVVPEGYVLMPIVPDEGMMLAGSDDQETAWDGYSNCRNIRRRVLAAVADELLSRQKADA
ncbi:hypothetical protein [Citrobacter werkmanii]|uniref:hypothetical protein n=1 Tax=Citrobacter werkmanii TaxID=67827 RepID=UPI0037CBBECB